MMMTPKKQQLKSVCFFLALLSANLAQAGSAPGSFTYQGRLFDGSSNPLTGNATLTLTVYNAAKTCLLYEETQAPIDLTASGGIFSVRVGAGTRTGSDPSLSFAQVFANTASIPALNCGVYTPTSGEARLLQVKNTISGVTTTLSPDQTIVSVPFATVAETLNGKIATDFINVTTNATQANIATLVAGAGSDASSLHNHDSLYLAKGGSANNDLGSGISYSGGNLVVGGTTTTAKFEVDTAGAAVVGEIIKATGGQTADLLQWQDSAGTVKSRVTSDGRLGLGATTQAAGAKLQVNAYTTTDAAAQAMINTGATTNKGLVVQGVAAQTGSLFEAQSSVGAVLASISSNGTFSSTGGYSNSEHFGTASTVSAADATSFGYNATAGAQSVAMGSGASNTSGYGAVIGFNAIGNGVGATVLGSGATASGGTNNLALGRASSVSGNGAIALGYQSTAAANQFVVGSPSGGYAITDTYIGNGVSNATPAATTLHSTGGSGTNIAGADLVLAAGVGTGTGAGGSLTFQTAAAGGAGSASNSLATRMTITAPGYVGIGTAAPANPLTINAATTADSLAQILIATGAVGNKGLVIQGKAAQTANLQEWQDSTGAKLLAVGADGYLYQGTSTFAHNYGLNAAYFGKDAGNKTGTGVYNTGLGDSALKAATTGGYNTAVGTSALSNLTTGTSNVGVGVYSMQNTTTGANNTAVGNESLRANTIGSNNAAFGTGTLTNNTGDSNTAFGHSAGYYSTSGIENTFIGRRAFVNNTTGSQNTSVGYAAGEAITTGSQNTFLGKDAGKTSTATVTNSTAIGYNAQVTASNALVLGNGASVGIGTTAPANPLTINASTTADSLAQILIATGAVGNKGLVIQAKAGQTANLFEVQKSDGTVVYSIGATGVQANPGAGSSSQQVGTGAAASANTSTAYGNTATASGTNGTTTGYNSTASSTNSTAYGANSSANTGANTTAIGSGSTASATYATALGADSSAAFLSSLALGDGATTTAANQMVMGSTTAAISDAYFGNGVTAASPGAVTINSTGGAGTNIAGADLKLAGGKSTGTGAGGSVVIATSPVGSTGTTLNSLIDRVKVDATGLFNALFGAKINTGAAATKGLIVQGAASQTANLQEWQDSTGATLAYMSAAGDIRVATSIYAGGNLTGGLQLRDGVGNLRGSFDNAAGLLNTISGYSVNGTSEGLFGTGLDLYGALQVKWRPASYGTVDTALARNAAGVVEINNGTNGTFGGLKLATLTANTATTADSLAQILAATGAATNKGIVVQGAASQTANLQEWQDSTGAKLLAVGADGGLYQGTNLLLSTYGTRNAFYGPSAGNKTTTGTDLVGVGYTALTANTSGLGNTAIGSYALSSNTTGTTNTAMGWEALKANTTGSNLAAVGRDALMSNTTGQDNTALGSTALSASTTGDYNTAVGKGALGSNTTGYKNSSLGHTALYSNTTGFQNLAFGFQAGYSNTTGNSNTYIGYNTGFTDGSTSTPANLTNATAIGSQAQVTVSNGFVLGNGANVGIGTSAPANPLTVNAPTTADSLARIIASTGATTNKGIVVQGKASQTANLFEAQDSTGAILASIASDGSFTSGAATSGVQIGTNSTTLAIIKATGSLADIPLVLIPKGQGAVMGQVPDSAITAGNARGNYATDWQRTRLTATDIASADWSTIAGGKSNGASGTYSAVGGGYYNHVSGDRATIAGGDQNQAAGTQASIAGGNTNNASGNYSSITGGSSNTASAHTSAILGGIGNSATANYSAVIGGWSGTTRLLGEVAHANGAFAAQGDAQYSFFMMRNSTTDATATELYLETSNSSRLVLPNSFTFGCNVSITARQSGGTSARFVREVIIKRDANAAATSLLDSQTIGTDYNPGAWAGGVALSADTTNGSLKIAVTGAAATNVRWGARVTCEQVGY